MTNGIWHAMHTADKGEESTVHSCTFYGKLELFICVRCRRFSPVNLYKMHLKFRSGTVWKCVGERKREKERRGDEKKRRMTPTLETDLGGKSHSPPLAQTERPKTVWER